MQYTKYKNRVMSCVVAGLLFHLPVLGNVSDSSYFSALLIRNVAIVDAIEERVEYGRDVTIVGDVIERIERTGSLMAIPEGAVEVDGTGLYMIPALWDMHFHPRREEDFALFLANGVLGVRAMWGNEELLAFRDRLESGELAGPRMLLAGPIVEGTPPEEFRNVDSVAGRDFADTPEQAREVVRRQHAAGYDFIKVYNNLEREVYQALKMEAIEVGMDVVGHVPFQVGLLEAFNQKQRTVEHLRGYIQHLVPTDAPVQPGFDFRSRELSWEFIDLERIDEMVALTVENEAWNCPTLSVVRLLFPQSSMEAFFAREEARYLAPSVRHYFLEGRHETPWMSNFSDEDFAKVSDNLRFKQKLVLRLHQAGAELLAGTDTWLAGFDLHEELELLVGSGLTPLEVLRIATHNPARFFGEEAEAGRVAAGMRANLVLVSANPAEDIRHAREVVHVIKDGKLWDRGRLDQLLEEVAARQLELEVSFHDLDWSARAADSLPVCGCWH